MATVSYPPTTTSGTTGGATFDLMWQRWITTSTATSFTVNANTVWTDWVDAESRTSLAVAQLEQQEAELEQQRREYESRCQLQREQEQQRRTQRQAAEARARELLPMVLTADQLVEYETHQQVTVQAPSGRRYVVRMDDYVHGNICEVDEHRCRLASMCVAPAMYERYDEGDTRGLQRSLPLMDGWIGQILALTCNEEELLAKANRSMVRPCQVQTPSPGLPDEVIDEARTVIDEALRARVREAA